MSGKKFGAAYIVKRRWLELHERGTVSQVRRVRKFSRWQSIEYVDTLEIARTVIEHQKSAHGGLIEYGVFCRGRRVA